MTEMLENGQKSANDDKLNANNQSPETPVSSSDQVKDAAKATSEENLQESEKNLSETESNVKKTEPIATDKPVETSNTVETEKSVAVEPEKLDEAENAKKSATSEVEQSLDEKSEKSAEGAKESEPDYDLDLERDAGDKSEDDDDDNEDDDEGIDDADDDNTSQPIQIDEIVANLQALVDAELPDKKAITEARNQFYRAARYETEQQKNKFIEEGGDEIDFVLKEPPLFTQGKELLQKLKERRLEIAQKEEKQKEKNLARKLAIIERVKELTESQDDFNKIYQEFKSLQQEWNEIRLVPQEKVNELWKSYQHYVEIFYDLVRINNEFREYDFRKNLELKTELCEAAEKLLDEKDTVSAFHQLQRFHQEWRDIGPVARKDREPIWLRFKAASTEINKRYQAHFEELRAEENENLEKKRALCEELEAFDYDKIKTFRDWDRQMKKVLEIQDQWKQIGYVPRKWNSKIYQRYRAACDVFFKNKNEFYKTMREEMDENLKKKIALCERAEALKDSQDWKNTTQEMIAIQKEWKEIGIVPRKHSDSIWKRFIGACDYFFEQKKMNTSSRYAEEQKNMELKKEVIEKVNNLDHALSEDEALATLKELMSEFNAIGFVPYKQKDKIYKDFRDAVDAQFERLNIDKSQRRLESFKTNLMEMSKSDKAKGQFLHERERLMRQYDRMKNELQTYENNIGFLSVSSKKGNSLIDDMNKKVKKLKENMDLIVKKIEAIDREL